MTVGHEWDDVADGWDDAPGTREYAQGAFDSLIRRMADHDLTIDGMSVLDFGCGTGLLTELLVDRVASIDAVDPSPAMRRVLTGKIRQHRWGSVRVLADLPAGSAYDLIVCSSVLSFVDDHPATVALLSTHLAPGGLLVHWDLSLIHI